VLAAILCAMAVSAIGWSAVANREAPDTGGAGFAKRVAGTYVDEGEIGGGAFTGLQTLHVDGTHSSTNTNCCGASTPGPQSPGQGVWKRTGHRQVTVTAVIFVFLPDGTPLITARPTLVMDFDPDFQTATGTITTELFAFGQDPTDPDEIGVFGSATGTDTWRRLEVMDVSQ
jgi:hypothetical protein